METKSTQGLSESANQPNTSRVRRPRRTIAASAGFLLLGGLAACGDASDSGNSGDDQPTVVDTPATDGKALPHTSEKSAASDGFLAAISSATKAGAGVPVSVEHHDTYWLVELEEADGTETTVRIEGDSAEAIESETDQEAGQTTVLDRANVEGSMKAALAEVDGTVVAVSADDDSVSDVYSVDIQTADGAGVTEVELDKAFNVTKTEMEGQDN